MTVYEPLYVTIALCSGHPTNIRAALESLRGMEEELNDFLNDGRVGINVDENSEHCEAPSLDEIYRMCEEFGFDDIDEHLRELAHQRELEHQNIWK